MDLWGGVECTINRVGDTFHDQCFRTGHSARVEKDLELFARLGLQTLRTPVLWEHFHAAESWEFADRMMGVIERLNLKPILGLLHHGSGPKGTNLLDPAFPEKLAAYALQVARRFPWALDYTPINEPQTTARFCCLYGHWYPHRHSMWDYVRAMYHQMKGIVLAMAAIRSVQPAARLIHTEDGGSTFSTPSLEPFRVEREHRRWLGMDLICGRINRGHPLFSFLTTHGMSEAEVLWFSENAYPPSIVGLNYYVTSDRFLDDRTYIYPPDLIGGDTGLEPLVDIEAVRVRAEGIGGARQLLSDAWERYGLPVAITEAHLGCTVDEQMRWLVDVWRGAEQALMSGVDVRAVTSWGLLGLHDWDSLCTQRNGHYEPGVFDLSSGYPVRTELAEIAQQLAHGESPEHPALAVPGWWQRDSRLTFPQPFFVEMNGMYRPRAALETVLSQ